MKTLSRIVTKFTSSIVAALSCLDRVIFKGHLALAAPCELEYFVDRVLKVRRTDFMVPWCQWCPGVPWCQGCPGVRFCFLLFMCE